MDPPNAAKLHEVRDARSLLAECIQRMDDPRNHTTPWSAAVWRRFGRDTATEVCSALLPPVLLVKTWWRLEGSLRFLVEASRPKRPQAAAFQGVGSSSAL